MNREQMIALLKTPKVMVGIATVISAVAGAAAGYTVAEKRLSKRFEERLENEIAAAKDFYSVLHKTDDRYATPEAAAETLLGEKYAAYNEVSELAVEEVVVKAPDPDPRDIVVTKRNIFVEAASFDEEEPDDWDFDREIAGRDSSKPYIIHHDEFMENTPEFIQVCVTYYEGDDVLADQEDKVIDDVEGTVSSDNLKFGYGSKDNNIVYIRNEPLELDFEVTHSDGKYAREVLGFIEHSDTPNRIRKFRGEFE